MTKHTKTFRHLLIVTALLALNLAILGKAIAEIQVVSLEILPSLIILVPESVTFPRTILDSARTTESTLVINPNDDFQTIRVIDTWSGDTFHVNVTLSNLINENDEILPYSSFGIITLHANNAGQSVDTGADNNPLETNNVSSDGAMNHYYDPTNYPATGFPPNADFVEFPIDIVDSDPNDAGSVSIPITLMERTIDTPSMGVYSIGVGLRGNMTPSQASGNFTGELTFSREP